MNAKEEPNLEVARHRAVSFLEQLMANSLSPAEAMLSPMETRIVRIAAELMTSMVGQARWDETTQAMRPLSRDVASAAARCAVAAAVEIETCLHELRDARRGR